MLRAQAAPKPQHPVVHHGVTCDASGMSPIIGTRYHKLGEDYDLCEAEFAKLTEADKSLYEKIDQPRHHNPCHGFPRMFGVGGGRGFAVPAHAAPQQLASPTKHEAVWPITDE
jgi:hypothetical protein